MLFTRNLFLSPSLSFASTKAGNAEIHSAEQVVMAVKAAARFGGGADDNCEDSIALIWPQL